MCQAGFSSLTSENYSDVAEGKYKLLTAHRRSQLMYFIGNFSPQHFSHKKCQLLVVEAQLQQIAHFNR